MAWLGPVVRVVGAALPVVPALIQLQAELDAKTFRERLEKLEDPLSALHPDIRRATQEIYEALKQSSSGRVTLTADRYAKLSRALAILESKGYIKGVHSLEGQFVGGLWIKDPVYFAYMCMHFEDPAKVDPLVDHLESCKPGQWLDGAKIAQDTGLPLAVVKGFFQLYADKGFGMLSREVGVANYLGRA